MTLRAKSWHCCLECRPPHRPHLVCLRFVADCLWSIVSTLAVGLSLVVSDFICVDVASLARQISRAFCRERSVSLSSLLRMLSSFTPSTMRSLIKLSASSPNSQVFAFVRKSVTKWSMGSLGSWFLLLNTCLSQVTFFLGLQ